MNEELKKKTRIWSIAGKLDYYNFKSIEELPEGFVGGLAVVNHKLVKWNPYENKWDMK